MRQTILEPGPGRTGKIEKSDKTIIYVLQTVEQHARE